MNWLPYRPAKPATFAHNYLKTLLQTAGFWVIFLVLIPWGIGLSESFVSQHYGPIPRFSPQAVTGGILFLLGGATGLASGYFMTSCGQGTPLPTDCPRQLVIQGPYKYVRNPMAIGGILQGVAVGMGLGSWAVVVYALMGIPVWHFVARPSEEQDMRQRFGKSFEEYQQKVPLWIPKF